MQRMRAKTVTSLEGYALKSHILRKKILIRDKDGFPFALITPNGLCKLLSIPPIYFQIEAKNKPIEGLTLIQ